jgi:hypothetical protein
MTTPHDFLLLTESQTNPRWGQTVVIPATGQNSGILCIVVPEVVDQPSRDTTPSPGGVNTKMNESYVTPREVETHITNKHISGKSSHDRPIRSSVSERCTWKESKGSATLVTESDHRVEHRPG